MEKNNELIWEKYEAKFAEIERKLAGGTAASPVETGISENTSCLNKRATSAVHETGLDVQLETLENGMGSLLDINSSLREEIRFLKSEITITEQVRNELHKLILEQDIFKSQKETEIARLFEKNSRLEQDLLSLRETLHRRSHKVLDGVIKSHENKHVVLEGAGFLNWLSKPLIVVNSK